MVLVAKIVELLHKQASNAICKVHDHAGFYPAIRDSYLHVCTCTYAGVGQSPDGTHVLVQIHLKLSPREVEDLVHEVALHHIDKVLQFVPTNQYQDTSACNN